MIPRRHHSAKLVGLVAFFVVPSVSLAWRGGPPAGFNGSTASSGNSCQFCHGNTVGNGSVQIIGAPANYAPNAVYNITVRISDPAQSGAGFQISVEDSAGTHRGTLIITDAVNTQKNPSDMNWVNHTGTGVNNAVANWAGSGNQANYNLQWQAPATNVGAVTFWAAGNAINNDFTSFDDIIYLTNVTSGFGGTGACCNDTMFVCTEDQTQAACEGNGDRFGGIGSTCATIDPSCAAPTGACCDDGTGICTEGQTQSACEADSGRYGGDASTCATINPPCVAPPTGACCDDTRGECSESRTQAACETDGFRYGGDDSMCTTLDPPCEAPLSISLEPFVTGLSSPVDLTSPNDGSGRIFIADQTGVIQIVDAGGNLLPTPFLDVSSKMPPLNAFFDERGLLGLAFHPSYATNGRFFIRYSAPRTGVAGEPCFGTSRGCHFEVLAEYKVSLTDPNLADTTSEVILFTADEPQFNHDGGQVAFGPDGYLYFTLGDGGGAHDGLADMPPSHGPNGNGQNRFAKLGKLHRIDVDIPPQPPLPYAIPPDNPFADGVDGLPEIFAYGLRNPWRFSFDDGPGGDGTLWLSDVGQNLFEEVNIGVKGGNYGWVIREGLHCFDPFVPLVPPANCATTGELGEPLIDPVMEYIHPRPCQNDSECAAFGLACGANGLCENEGGISITGGFVYRGSQCPALVGRYVFGDFAAAFTSPTGRLYYFDTTGPDVYKRRQFFLAPDNAPLGLFLKSFGEDGDGELYVLASTALGPFGTGGGVFRIVPPVPAAAGEGPRYIAVEPPPSPEPYALLIAPDCLAATAKYLGAPAGANNIAHLVDNPVDAAFLTSAQWGRPVHATGADVAPSTDFTVHVDCGPSGTPALSGGTLVTTRSWGDVTEPFNPPSDTDQPDFTDISEIVNTFKNATGSLPPPRVDLVGESSPTFCTPGGGIDFRDISAVVDAFKGLAYPCPSPCP